MRFPTPDEPMFTVGQVSDSVLSIDFYYEEGDKGPYTPVARDVEMRRVTSQRSKYGWYLRGFASAPIDNVRVLDCTFDHVAQGNVAEHVRGLTTTGTTINGAPVR